MEDLSSEEIKNQLGLKEEKAIAWIIERHSGGMLAMLEKMGCFTGEAEDIVADAIYKAVESINTYQSQKGKFSTWLYRIARNAAIDFIRKRKKDEQLLKDLEEEYRIFTSKTYDPEAGGQRDGKFESLLDQLHQEERDLLLLKYAAGFPHKEIASRLGITEENCRIKLHRAAKKLKTLAKGGGNE